MSGNGPRGFDDGGLSPETAARVYDKIGRLQDTQSPFERPALDRLITLGRFDTATSVFESAFMRNFDVSRDTLTVPFREDHEEQGYLWGCSP